MEKIRITSAPKGQAPQWVRDAWIGLELPLHETQGSFPLMGATGGEAAPENQDGYLVDFDMALEELEKVNPKAVMWWLKSPIAYTAGALAFGKYCCELV